MGCCQRIIEGAIGLVKAGLGIDEAPPATVRARRDLCRACDRATRSDDPQFAANKGLTSWSRCVECNCFIGAKTTIQIEQCPQGKW